ncbi:MAG: hypothetical protein AAGK02_02260 [Pseudomonadota bacterium]
MSPVASRPLTERQQAVMERIDRRVPIKVIAQELGVSETRINQHIRALKDIYEAASLNELVETYRSTLPETEAPFENPADTVSDKDFSEAVYTKSQLPDSGETGHIAARGDPGEIVLSDVMPIGGKAPWAALDEPRVVPGALDGEHAVLYRLAAIVGIAFGVLAAVVLMATAAITISEALEGKAVVPVDEQGYT